MIESGEKVRSPINTTFLDVYAHPQILVRAVFLSNKLHQHTTGRHSLMYIDSRPRKRCLNRKQLGPADASEKGHHPAKAKL